MCIILQTPKYFEPRQRGEFSLVQQPQKFQLRLSDQTDPKRNMFFYVSPLTFVIALKVWQSILGKRGVLFESQTKILSLTLQVVLLPGIPPIQVCIPHKVVSCQTLIYWQGFRL